MTEKTSENPLLHKSKNTGKMIKLNFSRTLEIKQNFQKSKEHLF